MRGQDPENTSLYAGNVLGRNDRIGKQPTMLNFRQGSSSPQSLLTTDVDFALLERTYSTEILLEGQWGWSSSSFRTIWGP